MEEPLKTVKRWAGVIAGVLLSATCAHAAPPPAEVFFRNPDIAEAVLSPSGQRVAITSAKGLERTGLVVIDLATGTRTRVAQVGGGDVSRAQWINEDRLVFGVVDLDGGDGLQGEPGLFAVDADGKNFRQLVSRRGLDNGDDRLLSWNHRLLRVPTPRPGERNEEVLIAGGATPVPMWLNTRYGRTRNVDIEAPEHAVDWLTDGRGEVRVAITRHKSKEAAFWRAPGSKTWQRLYEGDLQRQPFRANSVDEAGNLYVTREAGPEGYLELARYDFQRGEPEAKAVVKTPGFDFSGDLITDDHGAALGVRTLADGEATAWFNPVMKALQQQADERFPGRVNQISCRHCATPDMVALVRSYSDRDPGGLYVYKARPADGEKAWTVLGRLRGDVAPEQMAVLDLHRIQARDGCDLPVWVTKHADATGPLPAVVLVHDGPWMRGASWRWNGMAQFLASRGYTVIEPEFRGSQGYGQTHFRAGFKQWGQAMQNDVADALRWAQKQGIASDKACIMGANYGGYSALMGLVNDPDLYRCGVAGRAITDLTPLLRGSWWYRSSEQALEYWLPRIVDDPVKDGATLAAHSPVNQAARIKAPVLLLYGDDDDAALLANGKRMREALRGAGNEPVWSTYAGEGHNFGFGSAKTRIDVAERLDAFLAKHLKPLP